ncbi:MAG: hypothetical protein JJU11_13020 [Candidatus Sumerlaeia bacterium]|nr:hypothetical protein [Candidatus Sumerlaeia bacterium]
MPKESDQFVVDRSKVVDYLLNKYHLEGKSKAVFFISLGFSPEKWETLSEALLQAGISGETIEKEANQFGEKMIKVSELVVPTGANRLVRTVWFRRLSFDAWRLVTAYPERGLKDDSGT